MKKIIIVSLLIIALLVIAGGVFWWQSQAEVRDLNKSLPSGVKVVKSLFGNDYTVVNKIDGYEFKTPKVWGGIEKVEYISDREEQGFSGSSIFIMGKAGQTRTISVDKFKNDGRQLKEWAQSFFEAFGLIGGFEDVKLGSFDAIKTIEDSHLGSAYVFFIKTDRKNYVFTGGSEEFIKEIILNGEW